MNFTDNVRGKDEDDGIAVEAPLEDEPSVAADLTLPIDDGTAPSFNATQYKVPPVISPACALTRVTAIVTFVLATFDTTILDTDGITIRMLGAPVGGKVTRNVGAGVGAAVGDDVMVITEGRVLETAVVKPALTSELVQLPVDTYDDTNAVKDEAFPFFDVTPYTTLIPAVVPIRSINILLVLLSVTEVIVISVDFT